MEENKMYGTAKGIIKYRLKSVVTNKRVRDNETGKTIEVDVSDMDQIKTATKESVMRTEESIAGIKEAIKREFEYIVQNFDSIYNDAYIELLSESERNRTLVVSEQENTMDENIDKAKSSSKKLTELLNTVKEHTKEDSKSARDSIEVLQKYRKANGEKEYPEPEGYDIVNISTAEFVKPKGSEVKIEVIDFNKKGEER